MKRALLILCVMLLALGAGLGWLLASESGLNWAYRHAAVRAPGLLTVERLQGRLAGAIEAGGLDYRSAALRVAAERVVFEWNPAALLDGELDIAALELHSLEIELPAAGDAETAPAIDAFPALAPPLPIRLGRLDIDGLRLSRGTQREFFESVRLAGQWTAEGLEIETASVRAADYRAGVSGGLPRAGAWPHRLRLEWRARLPAGAELAGSGRLDGNLDATSLTQAVRGAVSVDARLDIDQPLGRLGWRLDAAVADFDSALIDPELPPLTGALDIAAGGDLDSLDARGNLRLAAPATGEIETAFAVERLAFAEGRSGLLFERLALDGAHGRLAASGRLDWADALAWSAQVTARGVDPARFAPDWPGSIDADFDVDGRLVDSSPELAVMVHRLDGRLRDYPLKLAGRVEWSPEAIDIAGLELVSAESSLRLNGRIDQRLALDWSLDSPDLGQFYPGARGRLAASGRLDGERVAPSLAATLSGSKLGFDQLAVDSVEGRVQADLLDRAPWVAPDGRLAFDARAANMRIGANRIASLKLDGDRRGMRASADTDYGRVNLDLAGTPRGDGWQGRLRRAELALIEYGNWRLETEAPLSIAPGAISIERACLAEDQGARLCASLSGGADWRIDADADGVKLAWLQRWLPLQLNAAGQLDASARLHYRPPDSLLGEARVGLSAGGLDLPLDRDRTQRLEFSGGEVELRLADGGIRATARLGLRAGESCAGEFDLPGAAALTLNPERQRIDASARCNLVDLDLAEALIDDIDELRGSGEIDLRLRGTATQPRFDGTARIADASFSVPRLAIRVTDFSAEAQSGGQETLEFSAGATLAGGRLELDGQTRLDADAGWPTRVSLRGRELGLAPLIEARLPPGMRVEGVAIAEGELRLRLPDQVDGELRLGIERGAFSYPLNDDEDTRWQVDQAAFQIDSDRQGLRASAVIEIDDNRLDGRLRLPPLRLEAVEPAALALDGSVELRVPDLSPLGAWLTEINRPAGSLWARLDIDGTAASPRLRVESGLEDASLRVPRLGLALGPIAASVVTGENGALSLDATVGAEQGSLQISGRGQLDPASLWPVNIRIVGENFPAARIDVAHIDVSPDLNIEINDRRIDVSGEVKVPYARLRPRDITTADRVSADAVIVGDDQAPPSRGWQITSKTRLVLGGNIDFFGYGFDGKLGGNLLIEEAPGQPTRGTGEIVIISGRYLAYGQSLDIENGRLLFTGGPLSNPGLDVVATRTSGDVTAGLRVGGRLQQPELELYSEPAMGQTDALSYLLTGGPLETATSQQGAMMANAALAIGLSGGDRIARSLGDRFGFDDLRVESSATGEQASLVVGRYLSPRLYVSYGVGLIESINTLNLRYRISPRWRIEAESGAEQGADLLFSIER